MDPVDSGLAQPTLAARFTRRMGLMRGNGPGEMLTQVKITADAFVVVALEAEHGLCTIQIDRVFDLAVPGEASGIVEFQIHRQRLQLLKFVS
jgi:hypothetical protein